jgi:hypothetical protein
MGELKYGLAVAGSTLYGDGQYPVLAQLSKERGGRPNKIMVLFDDSLYSDERCE